MKRVEQDRAQTLRGQGRSIKEIARLLSVSPSTVSRWCEQITLTHLQSERLKHKQRTAGIAALQPWIQKNKQVKAADLILQKSLGTKDVGQMQKRDFFMLGLGLYWSEGYKKGSQEWGFTNSDPSIIRTILWWLKTCYDVPLERVHARVTINSYHERQAVRIMTYWSKQTGIPLESFAKPTFISGYGRPSHSSHTYYGTLRIKVRNGTSLRRRILASIQAASH